jgi:hypothetical protein
MRRWYRPVLATSALAACLLVATPASAQSAQERITAAAERTEQALRSAGLQVDDVGADLDFSGDPAATAVEVDYPPGAAGDRGVSGYHRAVAEVVWRSSPFRVDLLEVRVDNDPSPGSDSYTGDRQQFSAAALTAMFGPRPEGLARVDGRDVRAAIDEDQANQDRLWNQFWHNLLPVVLIGLGLLALLAVAVAVTVVRIVRRRRPVPAAAPPVGPGSG